MVSDEGCAFLEQLIGEAVTAGARLLAGGKRYKHPKYASGHYFTLTLLLDVTPFMRIAQEELFAPVCVVMKAQTATWSSGLLTMADAQPSLQTARLLPLLR